MTGTSFSTCHSTLDIKWWNSCRSKWCAKPWKKSTEPNKYMMELDTQPNCFPMLTWWWSSSEPSKAMAMLSCGLHPSRAPSVAGWPTRPPPLFGLCTSELVITSLGLLLFCSNGNKRMRMSWWARWLMQNVSSIPFLPWDAWLFWRLPRTSFEARAWFACDCPLSENDKNPGAVPSRRPLFSFGFAYCPFFDWAL